MNNTNSIQSVLDELRSTLDAYPREQIAELVARRDESLPELLKIFDDHEALVDDVVHGWEITPFFAMYILAHLQETKFCPVLLQVLSIEFEDRDEFDAFWGDLLFQDISRILFSVYDGNHQALTDFILNSKNSHETRSVVLTALGMAYAHEKINRSILVDVIQKAFAMEKDSEEELNFVLSEACMLVLECQLEELKADAVWMIENKLHGFCKVEELEQGFAIEPQKSRADYLANPSNQRIQDIEESVTWWFQKTIEPEYSAEIDAMLEDVDHEDRPASIPFVREELKVGRNDNCPCGSGKKFKKCCGK